MFSAADIIGRTVTTTCVCCVYCLPKQRRLHVPVMMSKTIFSPVLRVGICGTRRYEMVTTWLFHVGQPDCMSWSSAKKTPNDRTDEVAPEELNENVQYHSGNVRYYPCPFSLRAFPNTTNQTPQDFTSFSAPTRSRTTQRLGSQISTRHYLRWCTTRESTAASPRLVRRLATCAFR